ncbi:MAG TPA: 4Fe-4S dicluster domain-containing protein [Candidatus Sulfomarinibacteraceae bacterium]|nr:4Fe-4S dicluster domain-containing protein [Candidatus Sulfomarinibacteraceae bacterium]
MPVSEEKKFYIDPSRCIGCQACVQACTECDTHKGQSMINLDFVDRSISTQTVPVICMHCESPTCAEVCPADAIKRTADGVVQTARKPRCIACNNCVLACPFGVPKMNTEMGLMMKCDMCYDRTSVGLKPMCASVCPSQALFYGTREEIAALRPRSRPVNEFQFGRQTIRTRVRMMAPAEAPVNLVDVAASMYRPPAAQDMAEDAMLANLFMDESVI